VDERLNQQPAEHPQPNQLSRKLRLAFLGHAVSGQLDTAGCSRHTTSQNLVDAVLTNCRASLVLIAAAGWLAILWCAGQLGDAASAG